MTLSEDRVHVSLRLGPLLSKTTKDTKDSSELPTHPAWSTKAAGKRIVRRRTLRSPSHGVAMKKRRITKTHNSPCRKLMLDAITAGGRGPRKTQSGTSAVRLIPAVNRREKDFQPLHTPLP